MAILSVGAGFCAVVIKALPLQYLLNQFVYGHCLVILRFCFHQQKYLRNDKKPVCI